MFEGVKPGNATKEEQENLREEFRGHIRETESYNKMILSGNENVAKALNDPEKMSDLCSLVFGEILNKINPQENSKTVDQPQQSKENVMQQNENIPSAFR
jgi:hypothetical protein